MQTRNSAKLTTLAAVTLLGAAVGVSCSRSNSINNSGDVKLAVVLPGGVHIDSVIYRVLNSANATIAGPGSFNVTDPNATISLNIVVPVTPTGDAGDEVVLTATDSLGNSCTGTSARFPVLAGTNPAVMMTLACGSGTAPNATGNIGVTATVIEGDQCPNITSGVVAPDQISVGATASVAATATDGDMGGDLHFRVGTGGELRQPDVREHDLYLYRGGQADVHADGDRQPPADQLLDAGDVHHHVRWDDQHGRDDGRGGIVGDWRHDRCGWHDGHCRHHRRCWHHRRRRRDARVVRSAGQRYMAGHQWQRPRRHLEELRRRKWAGGDGTPANAYAVSFDGMSNFAELAPGADGLRLTREATLEIWVNNFFAEGEGSYNNMYSNRNGAEYSGFFGSIINPGNINNSQWTAGVTSDGMSWGTPPFAQAPGLPPSSTWTHFVATFSVSQGNYSLYINGLVAASAALTAPIVYSAAAVPRVGGEVGGSYFRGKFGEIRIWSAALSASEVQARYQAGAATYGIIAPSPTLTVTKPLALRLVATPCP